MCRLKLICHLIVNTWYLISYIIQFLSHVNTPYCFNNLNNYKRLLGEIILAFISGVIYN